MQHSTDRMYTTHVGSRARPSALLDLMRAGAAGQPVDGAERAEAETPGRRREIHPQIVWAKFGSLAEGARRATARLWR